MDPHKFAIKSVIVALFAFALVAPLTLAQNVKYPTELGPDDSFRLIFVTEGTISGDLTSLDDYNAFATSQANSIEALEALQTNWYAVVSHRDADGKYTSAIRNVSAGTSDTDATAGFYNLNGEQVAANNAALWNASSAELTAYVETTQSGALSPIKQVWTGSQNTGKPGGTPLGLTNPNGLVTRGSVGTVAGGWLNAGTLPGDALRPIYVVSDVIWIPEPSACGMLFSSLALALVTLRRRRTGHLNTLGVH
jgi:hypothetical protein